MIRRQVLLLLVLLSGLICDRADGSCAKSHPYVGFQGQLVNTEDQVQGQPPRCSRSWATLPVPRPGHCKRTPEVTLALLVNHIVLVGSISVRHGTAGWRNCRHSRRLHVRSASVQVPCRLSSSPDAAPPATLSKHPSQWPAFADVSLTCLCLRSFNGAAPSAYWWGSSNVSQIE